MTFAELIKNIATIAAVSVPVLGNILSAAKIVEGIVGQLRAADLAKLPAKADGTPYTQADVLAAAQEASAAWHAADLPS